MSTLPRLGTLPSQDDLVLKVSSSGTTFLSQYRYKTRYTGNKYSSVDINGKLWLRAVDLKKHIHDEWLRFKGIKKGTGVEPFPGRKSHSKEAQISDNLSTQPVELLTSSKELSTRQYKINKKEVRQRLLGFMNTMKGKRELYFWTVSFPQGMSDELCYQAYNTWLTSLRKYKMLKEYLWVAERQQNGTCHFHIGIPHRMDVYRANRMMAGTLKGLARKGELKESIHKLSRYNGVDIAKNRKTGRVVNFAIKKGSRALATYLTKYVTKNDGGFKHLAWHNSRGYSGLFTGVTFTLQEYINNGFGQYLNRKKIVQMEFATFIPWLVDPPPKLTQHLYELNSYLQSQLN